MKDISDSRQLVEAHAKKERTRHEELSKMSKAERLDALLSTPFLDNFSENALRVRRNLLAVSFVSLCIVIGGLEVHSGNFFGLEFSGLNTNFLISVLCIVCAYHLIHFLFEAADYIEKWRLRVTACANSNRPVMADHNEDYSYDPSQSTLYNWWEAQSKSLRNPYDISHSLQAILDEAKEVVQQISTIDSPKKEALIQELNRASGDFNRALPSFSQNLDKIKQTVEAERIIRSLRNFDQWFWNYQWFQITRLMLIEFVLPISLGVCAVILTSPFPPFQSLGVLVLLSLLLPLLTFLMKIISKIIY